MVTKYKCSECHTEFTDHEAYCENWREPDKKFGCPGCKTMFRKKDFPLSYKWASTIYLFGVVSPSVSLGPDIAGESSLTTLVLLGMQILSSTAIFALYSKAVLSKYSPIERVSS